MKLVLEEAETGFIVEEDPETVIGGVRTVGKKHVFADLDAMQEFISTHYEKRGKKRKKKTEEPKTP